jgi:glycosyltransferase involved in cell wall biosynthesis
LSTFDRGGGAEGVALDLHQSYLDLRHDARMIVRYRKAPAEGIAEIDAYQYATPYGPFVKTLEDWIAHRSGFRGQYHLRDWARRCAFPVRWLDHWRGREDFNYPYAWHLADRTAWKPDVIHAHNLHGDYFDLRALTVLGRQVPLVWTLHDTWAITGHCGYYVDCQRWREGCGDCPDLKRPPAIARDRTAENWRRKRQVYKESRVAVATPSRWLMSRVEESMLQPWRTQVVPYGVDRDIFKPGDRARARAALGLPPDSFICISVALSTRMTNPYKDFAAIDRARRILIGKRDNRELLFLYVGDMDGGSVETGVKYTGHVADPGRVALCYQAADVTLHAAHADNFPCVVLEALACGTPVIATAVGGIPEQIREGETGFLVPRGDSQLMAERVQTLWHDEELRNRMGLAAAADARERFDLKRQAGQYLSWYQELLDER